MINIFKCSIKYVEIINTKEELQMAEINQENGVFGGVSFGNEVNENAVVENAVYHYIILCMSFICF